MHPDHARFPAGTDPRIAFFDDLAGHWDATSQDAATTVRQVADHTDLLRLKPGERLLEVGCGTGQLTGWLADQVSPGRVIAIDFAQAMIDQARRKKLPAEFRRADVCCDDLGEGSFDVALCFHSFPHFRDPIAAVRNLSRALRIGGRLLVMHLAGSDQINAFHGQVGGVVGGDRLPERSAWQQLLADADLELQHCVDRDGLFLLAALRVSAVKILPQSRAGAEDG